jgi:hypothetical protein
MTRLSGIKIRDIDARHENLLFELRLGSHSQDLQNPQHVAKAFHYDPDIVARGKISVTGTRDELRHAHRVNGEFRKTIRPLSNKARVLAGVVRELDLCQFDRFGERDVTVMVQ